MRTGWSATQRISASVHKRSTTFNNNSRLRARSPATEAVYMLPPVRTSAGGAAGYKGKPDISRTRDPPAVPTWEPPAVGGGEEDAGVGVWPGVSVVRPSAVCTVGLDFSAGSQIAFLLGTCDLRRRAERRPPSPGAAPTAHRQPPRAAGSNPPNPVQRSRVAPRRRPNGSNSVQTRANMPGLNTQIPK